ncbi:MAG: hypothetical protein NT163_06280 [Chlorobiales bacterium]|nr:hypothetical protein [Chlorobiales bacterium]
MGHDNRFTIVWYNKVAIVTSASRGIGRSIAQVAAAEGIRLLLLPL